IDSMRNNPARYSAAITRCKNSLRVSAPLFVLLFVAFLVMLFLRTGYGIDSSSGQIYAVDYKYFLNMVELVWPLIILLLGVILVLSGITGAIFLKEKHILNTFSFYITGAGTVLAVWPILVCAAFNNTAYYPSIVSLQDSLTLSNSSSSEFTLKVMSYVSLAIPFVVAYIAVVWKKMSNTKKSY
ncbi:MAG: cytochrome d ubiquinol oxidase subunit II, partial [Bacteroidales bacterium]|nr:cytochrome d ubiquinol oxidase subunit II [Bacteroidales bacterium]